MAAPPISQIIEKISTPTADQNVSEGASACGRKSDSSAGSDRLRGEGIEADRSQANKHRRARSQRGRIAKALPTGASGASRRAALTPRPAWGIAGIVVTYNIVASSSQL